SRGNPMLVLTRIAYDEHGSPLGVTVTVIPGLRHELEIDAPAAALELGESAAAGEELTWFAYRRVGSPAMPPDRSRGLRQASPQPAGSPSPPPQNQRRRTPGAAPAGADRPPGRCQRQAAMSATA